MSDMWEFIYFFIHASTGVLMRNIGKLVRFLDIPRTWHVFRLTTRSIIVVDWPVINTRMEQELWIDLLRIRQNVDARLLLGRLLRLWTNGSDSDNPGFGLGFY